MAGASLAQCLYSWHTPPCRAGRKLVKGLKDLLAAAPKPLSKKTFPQQQVRQTFLRFFVR